MKHIKKNIIKTKKHISDDALIQSIGEGVIVMDASGRIIKANKEVKKILGFSEKDLLGKLYWETVLEVDDRNNLLPKEKCIIFRAPKSRKTISGNVLYLTSKRRKLPVFLTISQVILNRKITGTVIAFRDITEERAVDKAKTEFVSLTSHQLRTPLTTIKWYAEMLLGGDAGELKTEQRDYINEILQGANEMSVLLNTFLNVSRIELDTFSVEPEEIHIENLAESVIHEILPEIQKKKITLKKSFSSNLPTINADKKLLRVILQNLITNSIKYTQEGGEISINISIKKKNFVIIVKDNGYGIPEGEQSQIFKKMFRASNAALYNTEGTGLGLYIVKSILESVHGKIHFNSKEGWGTEFFVTLPLSGMKTKKGTKKIE